MKKTLIFLIIILAICSIYQFVVRPMQKDKKLNGCLDSMWRLYGNNDEVYKSKAESCYKEFKQTGMTTVLILFAIVVVVIFLAN